MITATNAERLCFVLIDSRGSNVVTKVDAIGSKMLLDRENVDAYAKIANLASYLNRVSCIFV
jgi:hypothetical protein